VVSHLNVGHAARYATLGRLLLKHRGAPLTGPSETSDLDLDGYAPHGSEVTEKDAVELVEELVRMGPTFVKLGQLLSTRADLLPPVYLEALSRLRDDVEPNGTRRGREGDRGGARGSDLPRVRQLRA
jgi:predicted unusual protein kinase regulating ubiquinone biosynthesis (AarF/ABC1/UbiB family)